MRTLVFDKAPLIVIIGPLMFYWLLYQMSYYLSAIKAYFAQYIDSISKAISVGLYVSLFGLLVIIAFILVSLKGMRRSLHPIVVILLVEFVFLIYCHTVFFRTSDVGSGINLRPFWSYRADSADLQNSLYVQNMLNVLMFVPVGMLLGCAFNNIGWKGLLLVSLCLSVSIEALQFILHKGFSELDDVMHNVIGAALGYGIYCLGVLIWRKIASIRN